MKIIYSKTVVKVISNLDKTIRQRVKKGIEGLVEDIPIGDIKKMQGVNPPMFRLRIGKYRIIYQYIVSDSEQVLFIRDIGARGDIYN